ncbi:MAG: isoprenylcysteine carboxylmethyltransferase family protein [Nitrospirota bacterium]|nr:isoprenylcysteine carboxylmethyltransferase family protein [Nitrospirota bacterium]
MSGFEGILSGPIQWMRDVRLANRTGLGAIVAGLGLAMAAKPSPALFGVAALLALTGAVIRFWAAGIISKNRELATGGPYAYVRNPLYSGSFLIMVAFLMLVGNPWFVVPAVIGTGIIYVRTIRSEQEMLESLFGAAYRDYCEQVPSIIPWKGRVEVAGAEVTYSLEQSLFNKEYAGTLGVVAMLSVFYAYTHWIPQDAFRITFGVGLTAFVVIRAVRVSLRNARVRKQMMVEAARAAEEARQRGDAEPAARAGSEEKPQAPVG